MARLPTMPGVLSSEQLVFFFGLPSFAFQSAHGYDKQGCTFFLRARNSMSDEKTLHRNCILGYQEHKVSLLLERSLRYPRGFFA